MNSKLVLSGAYAVIDEFLFELLDVLKGGLNPRPQPGSHASSEVKLLISCTFQLVFTGAYVIDECVCSCCIW